MRPFDKIAAVMVKESTRPAFVGLTDQGDHWDMRWGAGMSGYNPYKKDIKILREYDRKVLTLDECERQFYFDYGPKPQPICARMGIISPQGDWYPCSYTCHRHVATALSHMYVTQYDPDNESDYVGFGVHALESLGWIIIGASAHIHTKGCVTQAQGETLRKVVEEFEFVESENPEIDWDKVLTENPEEYSEEIWSAPPTHTYGNRTFAQQLRRNYDQICGVPDPEITPTIVEPTRIWRNDPDNHPGD
jgi:hypothetical protein